MLSAAISVLGLTLGLVVLIELLGRWGAQVRRRQIHRWLAERGLTPGPARSE
jgi:hypothetical protein